MKRQSQTRWWFRQLGRILLYLAIGIGFAACSVSIEGSKPDVSITLASFVVTRAAHDAIIPKFQAKWQQEHHQRVHFRQSYGGSGAQTRAIIDGLPADIAHLALGLDMDKLVEAGLIEPGWEQEFPNQSIVSQSVAALIVREGNPKKIQTWADLTQPGVQVITADPRTSGVARWNFLALWHAARQAYRDHRQATEFLTKVFRNVPILARDAREATDIFLKQGRADALINYENEVLLALARGQKLEYRVPSVNIAITHPIAIVDQNVDKHGNREVVEAFVNFLYTPEAQAEFTKAGFRPVMGKPDPAFPAIPNLGTIEDYGGWVAVQAQFFADGAVFDQIQTELRR
ncbi:MAG: sulfate ABC transporter substrate-binding protein [Pseudanabaenaceae cyanobacterium]